MAALHLLLDEKRASLAVHTVPQATALSGYSAQYLQVTVVTAPVTGRG